MIRVRRYVGFVLALVSVYVVLVGMVGLYFTAWSHLPAGISFFTGIPAFRGGPPYIHSLNIMWWTLPGVISFRWVVSRAWRARMGWTHALALWGIGGALVYALGTMAARGIVSEATGFSVGVGIILTFGFGLVAILYRRSAGAGEVA